MAVSTSSLSFLADPVLSKLPSTKYQCENVSISENLKFSERYHNVHLGKLLDYYDGILGLAFLLFGFILQISILLENAQQMLTRKEKTICLFNLLGAGLLSVYAFRIENFYFAILETTWFVGAFVLIGTVIKNRLNKKNRAP